MWAEKSGRTRNGAEHAGGDGVDGERERGMTGWNTSHEEVCGWHGGEELDARIEGDEHEKQPKQTATLHATPACLCCTHHHTYYNMYAIRINSWP